jgi:hypothetical protein
VFGQVASLGVAEPTTGTALELGAIPASCRNRPWARWSDGMTSGLTATLLTIHSAYVSGVLRYEPEQPNQQRALSDKALELPRRCFPPKTKLWAGPIPCLTSAPPVGVINRSRFLITIV